MIDRDYPALPAPGYGPGASGELLRGGRVTLFAGGLDEMPEDSRTWRSGRIALLRISSPSWLFTAGVRWRSEQLSRRAALGGAPPARHRGLLT